MKGIHLQPQRTTDFFQLQGTVCGIKNGKLTTIIQEFDGVRLGLASKKSEVSQSFCVIESLVLV